MSPTRLQRTLSDLWAKHWLIFSNFSILQDKILIHLELNQLSIKWIIYTYICLAKHVYKTKTGITKNKEFSWWLLRWYLIWFQDHLFIWELITSLHFSNTTPSTFHPSKAPSFLKPLVYMRSNYKSSFL